MRRYQTWMFGAVMLATGYWLGSAGGLQSRAAVAFDDVDNKEAAAAEGKIRDAQAALQTAMEELRQINRYNPITDGLNSFLILSGGGDAMQDLESGNGVDPETFAAIYAGKAIPEVADQLGKDDEGRITFQEKPITIYSRSKLQRMFAERLRIKDAGL
ncbi:MAG: hypothetical protein ACK5Q5_14390 [Planctomycetaceae bacterium]